jgi:hypothetical protein
MLALPPPPKKKQRGVENRDEKHIDDQVVLKSSDEKATP